MGMTIDEAIEKYKNQAEWEHSHNNMDYCEEYEQLAKWCLHGQGEYQVWFCHSKNCKNVNNLKSII